MKFKGKPNMLVTVMNTNPKIRFRFDSNGLFETDNKILIKKLKKHFEQVITTLKEEKKREVRRNQKKYTSKARRIR